MSDRQSQNIPDWDRIQNPFRYLKSSSLEILNVNEKKFVMNFLKITRTSLNQPDGEKSNYKKTASESPSTIFKLLIANSGNEKHQATGYDYILGIQTNHEKSSKLFSYVGYTNIKLPSNMEWYFYRKLTGGNSLHLILMTGKM